VDIQGDTIVGEVEIEAPPDAVFDALVTPEDLTAWWGSDELYRTFDWVIDLRPGGEWSCQARDSSGNTGVVHGVYIEVDRPRLLAYTWNPGWDPIPETSVRYVLEPTASGTRLTVIHSGFAGHEESQRGHTQGWTRVLSWLMDYCKSKGVSK
jgi:uncharacterized protein YndB with AHSA1/START domain